MANPNPPPFHASTPAPAPGPAATPGPVQALVLRLLNVHNLSQGEIKRKTGIPQTRVSRYSYGKVPQGANDVFKLIELEKDLEAQAAEEAPVRTPG